MLRIRLSRTGKKNHPHYALVVTERTNPASDGNFKEKLGYYSPVSDNPVFSFDKARIEYWISVGAQPTETVARLLHKNGMGGMDKYVNFKKQYRKKNKKGGEGKEGGEEASAEAPVEEAKPEEEVLSTPLETASPEESKADESDKAEAPEAKAEEAPAEEVKEEAKE